MAYLRKCDACGGEILPVGSWKPAPSWTPPDVKELCWKCSSEIASIMGELVAEQKKEFNRVLGEILARLDGTMLGKRIPLENEAAAGS